MKSKTLPMMAALMGSVMLFPSMAGAEPGPEDLTKVYEAGRAAFNKGDLVKAKAAFLRLLAANPDFDLAKIYMAQIRHAEEKWEARPRSQKIAETAVVAKIELKQANLADALEVVRRELEKAGRGPTSGPVALLIDLPAGALERQINLAVRDLPMTTFIEVVAFAGGVRIAWHEEGLSVTAPAEPPAKPEPKIEAAIRQMKQSAQARIIPRIKWDGLPLADALDWLRQQSDPSKGPIIVVREPAPGSTITLDLRQIPLNEAIRSIAMVAGMELSWQPWGAGLSIKSSVAANAPTPGVR